mmetsp:Transcript_22390/g.56577  ORF Transcript_22390/g.56577 Transcript_22390/m.56577 type:complete len:214 (+) Transcript_22390:315-956(+)
MDILIVHVPTSVCHLNASISLPHTFPLGEIRGLYPPVPSPKICILSSAGFSPPAADGANDDVLLPRRPPPAAASRGRTGRISYGLKFFSRLRWFAPSRGGEGVLLAADVGLFWSWSSLLLPLVFSPALFDDRGRRVSPSLDSASLENTLSSLPASAFPPSAPNKRSFVIRRSSARRNASWRCVSRICTSGEFVSTSVVHEPAKVVPAVAWCCG